MSADIPLAEAQQTARALVVQAVFHVVDEHQAQTVAGKMLDRAQEIANLPECECDVDVSIERAQPAEATIPVEPGDAPLRGHSVAL